jgi:hypothetical protein
MRASTSLRVRPHTRDALNRLAQQDRVSAPELLDRLIEREEQERLLAAMNDDFLALRTHPAEWRDFKAETAAWDASSAIP